MHSNRVAIDDSVATGRSRLLSWRLGAVVLALSLATGPVWAQLDRRPGVGTLAETLQGVATQIAMAMKERDLKKVAVFEFVSETPRGESLGTDYGLLGKYCADALERELFAQKNNQFGVVDQRRLQTALENRQFTLSSLGSPEALKQLAESLDGLPAVVVGSIIGREGQQVKLRYKLIETASGDLVTRGDVTAFLDESEWAMLGRSTGVFKSDSEAAKTNDGFEEGQDDGILIGKLDERAKGAHPLADPNFPYRIKLVIDGKERQGVFVGNEYYVPVRSGETYAIHAENRRPEVRLLRLLVDGLNTLPEKEPDGTEVSAKRVSLSQARSWVMDPKGPQRGVYGIRGFVNATGAGGSLNTFKVVSAEKSLAAKQQFTSEIGIITAAFYAPWEPPKMAKRQQPITLGAPPPGAGGGQVGTGTGNRINEPTQTAKAKPGRLVAVLHIHYVDYDALPKLQKR